MILIVIIVILLFILILIERSACTRGRAAPTHSRARAAAHFTVPQEEGEGELLLIGSLVHYVWFYVFLKQETRNMGERGNYFLTRALKQTVMGEGKLLSD